MAVKQIRHLTHSLGVFGVITLVGIFVSCSSTSVTETWEAPTAQSEQYSHIATVGIASSDTTRRLFEDELVRQLQARGVSATPTYPLIPNGNVSQARVRNALSDTAVDAILATRMVGVDKTLTYVPSRVAHDMHYGLYDHYYFHSAYHPFHYEPGYYASNVEVTLETNLYDADTGKLVWSARSNTWDPDSVTELAASATPQLVDQLIEQGTLKSVL